MISIVICSRSSDISVDLKHNIQKTIGCNYELLVIDNSKNNYSIFSAYNNGIILSKGDVVCFMHDDVLFETNNWGKLVYKSLLDDSVGACAIAGSRYLRKSPSYYPIGGRLNAINIIGEKDGKRIVYHDYDDVIDIATFDGVFFCIKRFLFDRISFDDNYYKGFHFYDQDIAVQIYKVGFKIVSVPDLFLFHKSNGIYSKEWFLNSYLFYKKNYLFLPIEATLISEEEKYNIEKKALYSFFRNCIRFRKFGLFLRFPSIVRNVLNVPFFSGFVQIIKTHKRR